MKHKLLDFNRKGIVLAVFALAVLPAVFPGVCTAQGTSLFYPWWGPDELTYFTLPVGGWNDTTSLVRASTRGRFPPLLQPSQAGGVGCRKNSQIERSDNGEL